MDLLGFDVGERRALWDEPVVDDFDNLFVEEFDASYGERSGNIVDKNGEADGVPGGFVDDVATEIGDAVDVAALGANGVCEGDILESFFERAVDARDGKARDQRLAKFVGVPSVVE